MTTISTPTSTTTITARALSKACWIAERLADPATAPRTKSSVTDSLAVGAAGTALLHIEMARCGHTGWQSARAWLSAATAEPLTTAEPHGLYTGAAAAATALAAYASCAPIPIPYRALTRLDQAVEEMTYARLHAADARFSERRRPTTTWEYDLLRGLAGLGTYHLHRHPEQAVTARVLDYAVRLTEPLEDDDQLPPWWAAASPTGQPHPDYPGGHGNLGVAHGISALISLLALAVLREHPAAERQRASIHQTLARLCKWTDRWRSGEPSAPWWPGVISYNQALTEQINPAHRPRPAWCYGAAGTARALQLAGFALDDQSLREAAEAAMLAALRDPDYLAQLGSDPGLCHGLAGLIQCAVRMAADAPGSALPDSILAVTARLLDIVPDTVEDPGLLDGMAGTALALHTAACGPTPTTVSFPWDTVFALA